MARYAFDLNHKVGAVGFRRRLIVNSTLSGDIDGYQKSIEAINKALILDENQTIQPSEISAF